MSHTLDLAADQRRHIGRHAPECADRLFAVFNLIHAKMFAISKLKVKLIKVGADKTALASKFTGGLSEEVARHLQEVA